MTDQLKHAINAAKTAQITTEQTEAISTASSSAGEQNFDMSESSYKTSHTAVRKARRFAMQGLYEWLVTDRRFDTTGKLGWKNNAPHDIAARTRATNAMHTVHIGYYHEMMRDIPDQIESLDALIAQHLDREVDKLDTVEHAILLIGTYELQNRLEIPYKVVMDEAMKLNNHFGATDAHKLINAVLDRMAVELRAVEVQADIKANLRTSQKAVTKPQKDTSIVQVAEDKPTTSTKPRISANNANVKRNRPNKVNAGTSTAKAAAANSLKVEEESVKPVAIVASDEVSGTTVEHMNSNEAAINDESIVNDSVVNEPLVEDSLVDETGIARTVENKNTNDLHIDSIVGASVTESLAEAKDSIIENNVVKNDQLDDSAIDSAETSGTADINNAASKSND